MESAYNKLANTAVNIVGASTAAAGLLEEDPTGYDVELFFKCAKLKKMDTWSKSDPVVRVYIKDKPTETIWRKLGETEVIQDNLDPEFKKTVTVPYKFEMNQFIKFEVMDEDGKDKFELIGHVETSLGTVVGSKQFVYKSSLTAPGDKNTRGEIICTVVPLKKSDMEIGMKLGVNGLPVPCCFSSALQPYIVISRSIKSGDQVTFRPVHKSEISMTNTSDHSFQYVKIKGTTLCNADVNQIVQF